MELTIRKLETTTSRTLFWTTSRITPWAGMGGCVKSFWRNTTPALTIG